MWLPIFLFLDIYLSPKYWMYLIHYFGEQEKSKSRYIFNYLLLYDYFSHHHYGIKLAVLICNPNNCN